MVWARARFGLVRSLLDELGSSWSRSERKETPRKLTDITAILVSTWPISSPNGIMEETFDIGNLKAESVPRAMREVRLSRKTLTPV